MNDFKAGCQIVLCLIGFFVLLAGLAGLSEIDSSNQSASPPSQSEKADPKSEEGLGIAMLAFALIVGTLLTILYLTTRRRRDSFYDWYPSLRPPKPSRFKAILRLAARR